jgi:hypothetical protein
MRGRAARGWALRNRRRVVVNQLSETLSEKSLQSVSRIDQAEMLARLQNLQAVVGPTAGSLILERAIAGDRSYVGLATLAGAKVVFHDNDARKNNPGFPDIVMVVGGTLYFIECKRQGEKLRPAQRDWQEALAGVKEIVHGVLMPADYQAFVKEVMTQSMLDDKLIPDPENQEGE